MLRRSALIGLLAIAATTVFAPAASATISPGLTLEQGGGTSAGSSVATGFDINSHATFADSLQNLTVGLPAGLLLNLNANGGTCVASPAPTPLCQIASGTLNGATGTPVSLYLVTPPAPSGIVQNLTAASKPLNLAGVDLVIQGGETISGAVSLTSSPTVALSLSFGGIPLASHVKELQLTFSSMRLPTNCSSVESVTVQASSWQGGAGTASAPLAVSGCSALPYAPKIAAVVTKEAAGAVVEVQFTQGAGEAATNTLAFGEPPGVKLNKVLAPCFNGETCTVGTVAATSPLLPSTALSSGMLTLAGTINKGNPSQAISGSLTMSFPPPYEFSVTGPINIAEKMLSFSGVPDIPHDGLDLRLHRYPCRTGVHDRMRTGDDRCHRPLARRESGHQDQRPGHECELPAPEREAESHRIAERTGERQTGTARSRDPRQHRPRHRLALGLSAGRFELRPSGDHQAPHLQARARAEEVHERLRPQGLLALRGHARERAAYREVRCAWRSPTRSRVSRSPHGLRCLSRASRCSARRRNTRPMV